MVSPCPPRVAGVSEAGGAGSGVAPGPPVKPLRVRAGEWEVKVGGVGG